MTYRFNLQNNQLDRFDTNELDRYGVWRRGGANVALLRYIAR